MMEEFRSGTCSWRSPSWHAGKLWDRIVAPKDEELPAIVDLIEDLVARSVDLYLNVNNHYEGSAPLTIERIRSILTG